ncbi:DUF4249 family protein [candidate division KSB1 bacterium]|nr:DUF4249 family protein [candidate division KSB1 bacterium]
MEWKTIRCRIWKKLTIFRCCHRFIWFINFSLILFNCVEPVGPDVSKVTDIYIGCVLQTGRGIHKVFVYNNTIDPAGHPPIAPELFLQDAKVTLSCTEWSIELAPDSSRKEFAIHGPYFSTKNRKIRIEPMTTYTLTVDWQGEQIIAQTTTPIAPKFDPVDSLIFLDYNENYHSIQIELKWQSPYENHFISVSYISTDSQFPERWLFNPINGYRTVFDLSNPQEEGDITAVVYTLNEDYQRYQQEAENITSDAYESPQKLYSNIPGAHGVFAAMSNDTLKFRYRIRKNL